MGDEILRLEYKGHAIQVLLTYGAEKLRFNGPDICGALDISMSLLDSRFSPISDANMCGDPSWCPGRWLNYKGVLELSYALKDRHKAEAFVEWFVSELINLVLKTFHDKQIKSFDPLAATKFYL